MARRRASDPDTLGIPLGTLLPPPDTDPIPLPSTTEPILLAAPQVRAAETCGPCGSSLEVEWFGRTDTLSVIREWRTVHQCCPPHAVPDAGAKAAHIESIGFMPE